MNVKDRKISNSNGGQANQAEAKQPKRVKLTAEESLRRMKEFDQRRDAFIAAIRKSKG